MKKNLMVRFMTAAMCVSIAVGAAACSRTDPAAPASTTETSAKAESSDKAESSGKAESTTEVSAPAGTDDSTDAPAAVIPQEIPGADPSTWSPFTDCDSLSEAEETVGFKMTIPESINGYSVVSYAVMKEYHLLQVQFEADENHYITIRKAVDVNDISGDYNVYKETGTATVDGIEVTLKGNDGNICLATWTSGEYAYSIMCADLTDIGETPSHGLSVDQMTALVAAVR